MSRFFLALCLLAFATSFAFADDVDVVVANCTIGTLQMFTDAVGGVPFLEIVGFAGQLTYVVNTPHDFTSGDAWVSWDVEPPMSIINQFPDDIETIFQYNVNTGAQVTKNWPADTMRYHVTGFEPLNGRCSFDNNFQLRIRQHVTLPARETLCNWLYVFHVVVSTSVCGDPQFVGLRGQSFQIHGIDGAIYNLVSTRDYSVNSQFKFLTGPRPCPIMPTTGVKSSSCWSHDGSYLANFAFITSADEKFAAQSGEAATGFGEIKFNDRELSVGDSIVFSQGSLSVNSTHEITVQLGVFYMEIENVDGFVNLRRVRVERENWHLLSENNGAHGLLGQTWQNKRYSGKVPEIQGSPDDYVVDEENLFSTEFPYSRMVSK